LQATIPQKRPLDRAESHKDANTPRIVAYENTITSEANANSDLQQKERNTPAPVYPTAFVLDPTHGRRHTNLALYVFFVYQQGGGGEGGGGVGGGGPAPRKKARRPSVRWASRAFAPRAPSWGGYRMFTLLYLDRTRRNRALFFGCDVFYCVAALARPRSPANRTPQMKAIYLFLFAGIAGVAATPPGGRVSSKRGRRVARGRRWEVGR